MSASLFKVDNFDVLDISELLYIFGVTDTDWLKIPKFLQIECDLSSSSSILLEVSRDGMIQILNNPSPDKYCPGYISLRSGTAVALSIRAWKNWALMLCLVDPQAVVSAWWCFPSLLVV